MQNPNLTPREMEIGLLLADGYTEIAIADMLVIALSTVKTHKVNIYQKLLVSQAHDDPNRQRRQVLRMQMAQRVKALASAGETNVVSILQKKAEREVINPMRNKPLTKREQQVADLVSHGYTNRLIADALEMSTHTVKQHIEHIYEKMGITVDRGYASRVLLTRKLLTGQLSQQAGGRK